MPLITRPARNSAEKWDALLYRKKLDGDPQVSLLTRPFLFMLPILFWLFISSSSVFMFDKTISCF